MVSKKVTSAMRIVFWESARIGRDLAEHAFGKVGMQGLLPRVDHYGALHQAASDIVASENIRADGPVKYMALSHDRNAIGCEVRRFVKGSTRNELPFLFSLGAVLQPDGTYAIEVLDVDSAACPAVAHKRRMIGRKAQSYWEDACRYISANDITQGIVGLVKASHGVLLRQSGGVWYLPEDKADDYITVANMLNGEGVSMQAVRFDPVVNSTLVKHVSDTIVARSLEVFEGQIAALDDLDDRGGKPRSNGTQTRMEEWVAAWETLQHNKELLGKAFVSVSKAAREANERIGHEAIAAFV